MAFYNKKQFKNKEESVITEDKQQENPQPESKYSPAWEGRIGPFAVAVGKTITEITEALKGAIGEPGDDALAILADESIATPEELKAAFASLKIPTLVLSKNIPLLRGEQASKPCNNAEMPVVGASTDVLPDIPDDKSFTEMLRTGGVLEIGPTEVMSAIKATLANRVGLYGLPDKLLKAIEEQVESLKKPAPASYYELVDMLNRRNYGEVLSVVGVKGNFATQPKKKALLNRLEGNLWNSLYDFHMKLMAWQEAWMAGASNPGIMMTAMAALVSGNKASIPGGMLQVPDTSSVKDAAEVVINDINEVFAGTGIPVAKALAWDAMQIKKILEDERLPLAVGAVDREQMLKKLEVDVASDYVRLERNLVKYVMSILELSKVTPGQYEQAYLIAMIQLGVSIPWEKLIKQNSSAYQSALRNK